MPRAKRKQEPKCQRCGRDGHATLLWHWQHGWFCVWCIRVLSDMVRDFKEAEAISERTGIATKVSPPFPKEASSVNGRAKR